MPKIRIQTSQWFTNVGIKEMQSTAVYESQITNGPFKCQNLAHSVCYLYDQPKVLAILLHFYREESVPFTSQMKIRS